MIKEKFDEMMLDKYGTYVVMEKSYYDAESDLGSGTCTAFPEAKSLRDVVKILVRDIKITYEDDPTTETTETMLNIINDVVTEGTTLDNLRIKVLDRYSKTKVTKQTAEALDYDVLVAQDI